MVLKSNVLYHFVDNIELFYLYRLQGFDMMESGFESYSKWSGCGATRENDLAIS
jgi:formate hydrogenlyase subunit 4